MKKKHYLITKKAKDTLKQMQDSDFTIKAPNLSDLYKDHVCPSCGKMGLHRCLTRPADDITINHPPHYINGRTIEPIDVIDDWNLGFYEGQVLKYLARWRKKGGVQDLEKAHWYLSRCIKKLKDSHIAIASHTPSCSNPIGPV